MLDYLDQRNRDPKPFIWTADADLILGKVERLCKRFSNSGHQRGSASDHRACRLSCFAPGQYLVCQQRKVRTPAVSFPCIPFFP